jgi:hypothetical protein
VTLALCGNGIIDPGEECDLGINNYDPSVPASKNYGCSKTCHPVDNTWSCVSGDEVATKITLMNKLYPSLCNRSANIVALCATSAASCQQYKQDYKTFAAINWASAVTQCLENCTSLVNLNKDTNNNSDLIINCRSTSAW